MSHGYALEHRKVAFDAGLLVDLSRHVHHLDGDKANNDLANLDVKAAALHASEHVIERGYVDNQYGRWPLRDRQSSRRM